ncbi:MAG: hypothetical protein PHR65_08395 [Syntrophomonadaceae bacterium]|nr:hypothetical protein [Syntrophomonadaceae bacterium]
MSHNLQVGFIQIPEVSHQLNQGLQLLIGRGTFHEVPGQAYADAVAIALGT